jgi:4-alpha-glucanotransferase
MLPVGPPGYGESPYSAQSSFAGSPLLVAPEGLVERGWLERREADVPSWVTGGDRVDYLPMSGHRMEMLRAAFRRWSSSTSPSRPDAAYEAFCARTASWLDDFALFRALKAAHGGVAWTRWREPFRRRAPAALAAARGELAEEIAFEKFAQYAFDEQWRDLRAYAAHRGVALIGDIPIFVAHDSADVWQDPEAFFLDDDGEPTVVAGVPPDYFSATGQRWGNPLYRWKRMKRDRYRWWESRLRTTLGRFDAIRLDHFVGFERYWRIPAGELDAIRGRWVRGPGADFFQAMKDALGDLPLIAEDLGAVNRRVFALRDRFGLPGIKVLQFAFGSDPNADSFQPHNYPRRAVVYTGTHDNDTTVGWFRDEEATSTTRKPGEADAERAAALRYLGTRGEEIHWDMIRIAFASVAHVVIVPVQDVLGLGSAARMNRPGTATGNWTWRMLDGALTPGHAAHLAELSATYERAAEAVAS